MHVLRISQWCSQLSSNLFVLVQVTDEVAGVVRWKRYLDFLIFSFFKQDVRDYDRMEPLLRQVWLVLFSMLCCCYWSGYMGVGWDNSFKTALLICYC